MLLSAVFFKTMGKLILVPTPIGNLGDITFRAVEALKEADLILAEDTRTSGKLLKHYGITTPTQSHHAHNEHKKLPAVIDQLRSGMTIAVISDAGTPGISDPGFLLSRACIENGIAVDCLPGATALVPALVLSGLPSNQFVFEGFLPVKKGRRKRLDFLADETRTMVFYESPHKLLKTLTDLSEVMGEDRQVSVSRELTKMYEETVRGSLEEVFAQFTKHSPRGEFVVVLAGKG